jgi:hypothetical protein
MLSCPPDDRGALALEALEAARKQICTSSTSEDVSAETPEPVDTQRAYARGGVAETLVTHGPTPCAGGERHEFLSPFSYNSCSPDGVKRNPGKLEPSSLDFAALHPG